MRREPWLCVLTVALCLAAAWFLSPLWAPLLLAAWFADLLGPLVLRLERRLGGRRVAAAVATILFLALVLAPLVGVGAWLVSSLTDLADQVHAAFEGRASFAGALLDTGVARAGAPDWATLAQRFGADLWRASSSIARASAGAAIAAIVFVSAVYTFLVQGDRARAWLASVVPLERADFARLAAAFQETGRGLLVAGGGTALVQGALATAAYVAIGVPRALVLGPLTAVCALVPFVGTGVVWLPLAIGLAASKEYGRAGMVLAVGVCVGLVDNFVRPFLTRYGRLELPTFVVLVSMLGGVAALGPTGALLGPLVVRLCVEALAITSEWRRTAVPVPATGE